GTGGWLPTITRPRNTTELRAVVKTERSGRGSQHFGQKFAGVERREVVDLLAGADEACWDFQFVLNRDHDSAFAAAVEFGYDQTGELKHLMKFARLTERVTIGRADV